jgi:hypothetical protein
MLPYEMTYHPLVSGDTRNVLVLYSYYDPATQGEAAAGSSEARSEAFTPSFHCSSFDELPSL